MIRTCSSLASMWRVSIIMMLRTGMRAVVAGGALAVSAEQPGSETQEPWMVTVPESASSCRPVELEVPTPPQWPLPAGDKVEWPSMIGSTTREVTASRIRDAPRSPNERFGTTTAWSRLALSRASRPL